MRLSLNQQAIAELFAETCYCGAPKVSNHSFCNRCYYALPEPMRRKLYKHISDGYATFYDEAKEYLRDHTNRIQAGRAFEIKEREEKV